MATALTEGSVRLSHFTDERVRDPQLMQIMEKVRTVVHPELRGEDTFLLKEFTDVAIELDNRRSVSVRVPRIGNRGSRDRPVTLTDLEAKFMDCASGFPNPGGVRAAFDKLARLETLTEVREVSACLKT